jgi:hypothetical protein
MIDVRARESDSAKICLGGCRMRWKDERRKPKVIARQSSETTCRVGALVTMSGASFPTLWGMAEALSVFGLSAR